LVQDAANGSCEPEAEVMTVRCVRSQRGICCVSVKFGAAARRKNQPFVQSAAIGLWLTIDFCTVTHTGARHEDARCAVHLVIRSEKM